MGSSSLIGDQTQVPCIGSVESKPLNHQGSPPPPLPRCLKKQKSRVKSKPPSYSCLLTFPSWKQALLQFYISFKKRSVNISSYVGIQASLVAQLVKNLPAMRETPVWLLVQEVPLEKGIGYPHQCSWASLMARTVKNLPAMQETLFQFLGEEDFLEKEMATHPNILAWRIPRTEEPGGLQSTGLRRVGQDWVTNTHIWV